MREYLGDFSLILYAVGHENLKEIPFLSFFLVGLNKVLGYKTEKLVRNSFEIIVLFDMFI